MTSKFPFSEIHLFKSVFSVVLYMTGCMKAPILSAHVDHKIQKESVPTAIIKPSYKVPRNNQWHCSAGYFL